MSIIELRGNISTVLEQFPNIDLIYLFGSRVGGEIGPMSDYDFAFYSKEQKDLNEVLAKLQHALTRLLNNKRIDVVILNRAPIELSYNIISSGELIYQKSEYEKVEFEAKILGKYGDFLPNLREYKKLLLEGGGHAKRVQRYRESLERTQRTLSKIRAFPKEET